MMTSMPGHAIVAGLFVFWVLGNGTENTTLSLIEQLLWYRRRGTADR